MNLKENVIQETAQMSETEKMAVRNTNSQYLADQIQLYDGKFEQVANKVTEVSASSTDTEYPSAKCLYDRTEPLYNKTTEHIVERGSDDMWYRYEKWSSGTCKLYGRIAYQPTQEGTNSTTFKYPFPLVQTPIININIMRNQSVCSQVFPANGGGNFTDELNVLDVTFMNVTSTDYFCYAAVEVISRWK